MKRIQIKQTALSIAVLILFFAFGATRVFAQGGTGRSNPAPTTKTKTPPSRSPGRRSSGADNSGPTEDARWAEAQKHDDLGFKLIFTKPDEAEAEFRKAIEITPLNATPYYHLGMSLFYQNKFTQAERAYRDAVHLEPKNFQNHAQLAICLVAEQAYPEAESESRTALRLFNEASVPANQADQLASSIYTYLGISLYYQRKNDEAQGALEKCIPYDSGPMAFNCHFWLARVFRQANKLEQAENEYRRTLQLNPQDAQAQQELNEVLRLQGKQP